MSDQYFERRQDRYFLFRDSPELADYYTNLVKSVGRFSFLLNAANELEVENASRLHPYETPLEKFVGYSKTLLAEFTKPNCSSDTQLPYDTYVYPLVQMGQLQFGNDCTVTTKLLETFSGGSHVKLATGYFNLVPQYEDLITNGRAFYDVLTAHPKANSFYKAAGAMYYIPVGTRFPM